MTVLVAIDFNEAPEGCPPIAKSHSQVSAQPGNRI
jgi:hypothetical protein